MRSGPPIARPGKIVCIGLTYRDHAAESHMDLPKEPVMFFKSTTAVVGPDDPLVIPKGGTKVDWEVELAVVIGKRASYVDEARALVHRLFDPLLAEAPLLGAGLDWKTSLQELTASANLGVPEYRVQEEGPDHRKEFTATVIVAGQDRGSGEGTTKKEAEQKAAMNALAFISGEEIPFATD